MLDAVKAYVSCRQQQAIMLAQWPLARGHVGTWTQGHVGLSPKLGHPAQAVLPLAHTPSFIATL